MDTLTSIPVHIRRKQKIGRFGKQEKNLESSPYVAVLATVLKTITICGSSVCAILEVSENAAISGGPIHF